MEFAKRYSRGKRKGNLLSYVYHSHYISSTCKIPYSWPHHWCDTLPHKEQYKGGRRMWQRAWQQRHADNTSHTWKSRRGIRVRWHSSPFVPFRAPACTTSVPSVWVISPQLNLSRKPTIDTPRALSPRWAPSSLQWRLIPTGMMLHLFWKCINIFFSSLAKLMLKGDISKCYTKNCILTFKTLTKPNNNRSGPWWVTPAYCGEHPDGSGCWRLKFLIRIFATF